MTIRVLVIGGPGRITSSTITALVRDGHEVSIATRSSGGRPSMPGVTFYRTDRNDRAAMERLALDVRPGCVIDVCMMTEQHAADTLDVFGGLVEQYIFLSTVDVYGYPLSARPASEDQPASRQNTPYAIEKRRAEILLASGMPNAATIVRVGYSFGSRFMISFISHAGGSVWIERMRAGRPIFVPDDGQRVIQPAHFSDTGRMIHRLVGDQRARGTTVNCAAFETMTHDQYVSTLAEELGVSAQLAYLSVDQAMDVGGDPVARGLLPVLTGHDLSYSTDRFQAWNPDFVAKSDARAAMRDFINWHDLAGQVDADVMDAEDRICRAALA